MNYLRQATASQSRELGPFLDDTDFKTAKTGLTIANTDIKLVANGGAAANKNSGGGTHRANGIYGVTFDATDTATVGELTASCAVAGALPTKKVFTVLEEAVYDAMYAAGALGTITPPPPQINAMMKYGVATSTQGKLRFALRTMAGGLAGSGDWTPTTGDVKVSIDGGAEANIGTLPAFANGAWELTGAAAELQGKRITVRISDSAPKAIADTLIVIETFGDVAALYPDDVGAPGLAATDSGTAQAGSANSITLKAGAPSVSLKDQMVLIIGGTGAGQQGTIKSYDTSSKVATMVANWPTTNPDSTSKYIVWPIGAPNPDPIAAGLVNAVG